MDDSRDSAEGRVHIRVHQRNGRKSLTTVAGLPEDIRHPESGDFVPVDFEKILRALKKSFQTNGSVRRDAEHGTVIQLQGDVRGGVRDFLVEATALVGSDRVVIHGAA